MRGVMSEQLKHRARMEPIIPQMFPEHLLGAFCSQNLEYTSTDYTLLRLCCVREKARCGGWECPQIGPRKASPRRQAYRKQRASLAGAKALGQ